MTISISEINSKRERIVAVFRARLAELFPTSQIDRGFFGTNVDTYDRFFIFDLPEKCTLTMKQRGQYQCQFSIAISYWIQLAPEELFPMGNYLLEKIRLAIETDERLEGLVLGYRMEEGALIWHDEGVLDVELLYVIDYTKDAGWVSNPFK